MDSSIKLISSRQRFLLIIPALLILLGTIAGFCWFFANSVAANAQRPEIAAAAVYLSPSDPLAHVGLATLKTRSFVSTDLPEAVKEFERAAALSPNDYRYWFALARTRERTGDAEGAEKAARRALELAPNYAQVLWLSGNILLRRGKTKEAFEQMRRAAEADPQFAIHFINAAGQTAPELADLRQIIGDAVPLRSALVTYLTQDKKLEAALSVWQELPEPERRETGKDLFKALLNAKKYRAALPFYALTATNEWEKPLLNHFLNGGFENDIITSDANPFIWQISEGAQPQIASYASIKHGGERSLIIVFNSPSGTDFRTIAQTVTVENDAQYHFETFVKTEKLQSVSTVYWEVLDAGDEHVLAKTTDAPTGDNDWQKLTIDFKTTDQTEAVTFRLMRAACSSRAPCSITGKIWFDDFALQKTSK